MSDSKEFNKFFYGKNKSAIAKIYAYRNGREWQYYVFSKKSLKKAENRKSTYSIRYYR